MRRRGDDARETGSLVVEAAVGIGLLAVVTASLATVLPAVLDARDRADAQLELLRLGEDVLEHVRAGSEPAVSDGSVAVAIVRATPAADSCSASVAAGARGVDVHLVDIDRPGSRELLLRGTPAPRVAASATPDAPAAVRVHRPQNVAVQLTARTEEQVLPLIDGDGGGCAVLTAAAPGRYELAPADPASPLIGPTHLLLGEHPLRLTVDDRSVDRDLHVTSAAQLTVHADPVGGRVPDVVSAGSLVWTVRGDDARISTQLGAARAVHPGTVTVVVSACRSAETSGSSAQLIVEPGQVHSAAVPLATVTLLNIGTRTSWTLNASRFTECNDGSTRRPSLAWSGGLHDGMRIALPRGLWQLSLTTPGMPVSPRMLVPAGESDLVVVMG
jgi:type II secretory pathway pseudopilin PulG